MALWLRQIALVAHDLEAARADVCAVLGVNHAYADPGVAKYGLRNAVIPIGGTFLEIVSPTQSGTTAGRLLEKRGGDGGYMVILQTDALEAARATIAAAGARIVDQYDGDGVAFTHIHPRDVGGAILSIDAMEPQERWQWGGPDWEAHQGDDPAFAITGATVQASDPAAMAARWADVLGVSATAKGSDWCISLAPGTLRFTPLQDQRGEGLTALDIQTSDPSRHLAAAAARGLMREGDAVLLCGTWVRLERPPLVD